MVLDEALDLMPCRYHSTAKLNNIDPALHLRPWYWCRQLQDNELVKKLFEYVCLELKKHKEIEEINFRVENRFFSLNKIRFIILWP